MTKFNPIHPALKVSIVLIILLGVFLRFYHLDRKIYWYDEAFTTLRVSGYTRSEYIDREFQGKAIVVRDLQQYQQVVPEKNLSDVVSGLAEDVHPPLYFILTRWWMQIFGNSITAIRSLAVLFGVLAIPGLYWLCRELFADASVTRLSVAIFTISPFHILYAQEARMYSLLTVAIVFSSAALLKALRQNNFSNWAIYLMSLIIGFYSHLYFVFLVFSQIIYVALCQGFKLTKTTKNYLITFLLGGILFLPWIVVILLNLAQVDKITAGAQNPVAMTVLLKSWIANLGQVFIDIGWGNYSAPLVLILVAYSLYALIRYAPRKAWLFLVVLIGVNALVLVLPDLILGGQGSMRSRYFIPCYLGVEIAVAYLISLKLESRRTISRSLGIGLALFVFMGGTVSSFTSARAVAWWNKGHSRYNLEIARIINEAENPLIVSNTYSLNAIDFLALSHYLKPDVQLRLGNLSDSNLQALPAQNDLFIYNPSDKLRSQLEQYYQIQSIQPRLKLFRLEAHDNNR
jgi:uncharacterized membrane protein